MPTMIRQKIKDLEVKITELCSQVILLQGKEKSKVESKKGGVKPI